MRLGYNTNGLAHHSLPAAIRLLASLGYQSVAITIDHRTLNPYERDFERQVQETRALLEELGMRSVVETGARFLLDPLHKHEPTLVSPKSVGRPRRIEFLRHAVDLAAALDSDCVSLWSGVLHEAISREKAFARLVEGLKIVLDYADRKNVVLGFEPEPGMLIDTMASYAELVLEVDSPRSRQKKPLATTPCSAGGTPVVMFACTGQVTAGNPATNSVESPPPTKVRNRGIRAKSLRRNPGTDNKITCSDISRFLGVRRVCIAGEDGF